MCLMLSTRQESADKKGQTNIFLTILVQNVQTVEFHDHIWNHKISTIIPGICEIAVKIPEM